MKVRCGVIGAGWWGTEAHLPELKRHAKAEVVAIQTLGEAEAKRVAEHFGVPRALQSVEDLLAVRDLDAVIISSVPKLHYAQTKAALQRGLHVLVEKPMSFTAAEAEELLDLAKSKGVVFSISAPWHYTPHGIEAQRLVRSGASGGIGDVKMLSILMTNFTLGLYQGLPWEKVFGNNPNLQNTANPFKKPGVSSYSDPELAGGGQIYCQVSHAAAYVHFLTGREPAEVFARFDNAGTRVDVYDALNIKLEGGALVSLASTGATMLSDRHYEVRVYGTLGMLIMELWKGMMEFHDLKCNVKKYDDLPAEKIYPMFEPTKNFIDAIAGDAKNGSPAEHGAAAMKVIEAAVRSAGSGQNVKV
jgi:predicted dehydrogenase